MRTYRRETYTLQQVEHWEGEGSRAYKVLTPEGAEVGIVGTYMAAVERKSPRKRYVYARWHSERWYAQPPGSSRKHYFAYETPGDAARYLLRIAAGKPV